MCGIVARCGESGTVEDLLTALSNLEYRGYDSAGLAVADAGDLEVCKSAGTVEDLVAAVEDRSPSGHVALGHTRWSTHGPPTDDNAHPHTDCGGRVAVVHNGIVANHSALRERLEAAGHAFESDTDTEVVPHLLEAHLEDGAGPATAFRRTVEELEGSYAIVATLRDETTLYAARSGSPLVLGVADGQYYLASDVPAFLEFTDSVVYLEDGDVAIVDPGGYEVRDADGEPVDRSVEDVDWSPEQTEKGAYDHFMHKEIEEQPSALAQAVEGRTTPAGDVTFEELPAGSFEAVDRVTLVACGTSYHAAMVGQQFLSEVGVTARADLASEFNAAPPPLAEDALVVGVTQSGETADTLEALRTAREAGARTLAVTNVVGSTAVRETDDAVFIRAGPEIGVAATKTFSSQVAVLSLLAERLGRDVTGSGREDVAAVARSLRSLPGDLEHVLETSGAADVASTYRDRRAHFFIGRGLAAPIALEGALKFKEITYEHAEGFPAGELKHGPLALVGEDTPVYAVVTDPADETTLGNIREVQARGAPVVAVASEADQAVQRLADWRLPFPDTDPWVAPILANAHLQLVAYHVAEQLSRSIDKPRNLAKSVTVE